MAGAQRQQRLCLLAIFLKDHCLHNLHGLPQFEMLVSSLQARYPDHLGLL